MPVIPGSWVFIVTFGADLDGIGVPKDWFSGYKRRDFQLRAPRNARGRTPGPCRPAARFFLPIGCPVCGIDPLGPVDVPGEGPMRWIGSRCALSKNRDVATLVEMHQQVLCLRY